MAKYRKRHIFFQSFSSLHYLYLNIRTIIKVHSCFNVVYLGVSTPRGAINIVEPGTMHLQLKQTLLPSTRSVSNAIITNKDNPSRDFTLLVMQWGQFVDHDITFTPLVKGNIYKFDLLKITLFSLKT